MQLILRSELEACTDPRQRWTVAKRLLAYTLVMGLLNNLPFLMLSVFVNNLPIILCLQLNSCTATLYVSCLTHNNIVSAPAF